MVLHAGGIAAVRHVGFASRGDILDFLRTAPQRLEAAERKKRQSAAK